MKAARITGGAGLICLFLALTQLVTGFSPVGHVVGGVAAVLAMALLVVTFVLVHTERASTGATPAEAASSEPASVSRAIVPGAAVSGGLGVVAAVVAFAVAEGEARGHAVGHLMIGLGCVSLFALLAFWWRPPTGSTTAAFRGLLLALVWAASVGALLESLGGSGYDAANSGSRIGFLTSLHGYVAPFGVLFLFAVPLAVVTLAAVGLARAARHFRATPT